MKKLTNKKGFTLVELLVVVAIIAILMLIAIPRFLDSTKGAKIKTFEGNFRTVLSSIAQYQANNGGSVDKIKDDGTDVQKLIKTIYDDGKVAKPAGAKYELTDKNTFEATLDGSEIGQDAAYELKYDLKTGEITYKNAPAGAAKLGSEGK